MPYVAPDLDDGAKVQKLVEFHFAVLALLNDFTKIKLLVYGAAMRTYM